MKYTILTTAAALFSLSTLAHAVSPTANSDMVLIPAGEFVHGSDKVDENQLAVEYGQLKPFYMDEHPKRKIKLPAYLIDRNEVTTGQYRDFIAATGHKSPDYWYSNGFLFSMQMDKLERAPEDILRKLAVGVLKVDLDTRKMDREQLIQAIKEHYAKYAQIPVTFVSWNDADAYCKWAGKRLPTEAEWEKAARGKNGQEYPWGNDWRPDAANTSESEWLFGAAPVGQYEDDVSPYGVNDMAGNVSEWTADWYQAYADSDFNSDKFGENFKVARGGGWSASGHYALEMYYRGAYRINLKPDHVYDDVGFRCARDAMQASTH